LHFLDDDDDESDVTIGFGHAGQTGGTISDFKMYKFS